VAKLNDSLIKATPQGGKEYTLADGDGLYRRVRPTGNVDADRKLTRLQR
jgi:hypothetical protein